jgi:hypothetical protein
LKGLGPYRLKLGMKRLGDLSLRMLQRGKCLGVFVGRFGVFLLGRGSGISEPTSRASWAALGDGDSALVYGTG